MFVNLGLILIKHVIIKKNVLEKHRKENMLLTLFLDPVPPWSFGFQPL